MARRPTVLALAAGLLVLSAAPLHAEDARPATDRVVTLGDGAVRFRVVTDRAAGRLVLRSLDPAVRLAQPPVVVVTTPAGARELALVAVEGETGAFLLADDLVRGARFEGTLRVVVGGRTVTGPLVVTEVVAPAGPLHGGTIVAFDDCGYRLEVVRDFSTGTLTFYEIDAPRLVRPPIVRLTEGKGVTTLDAEKVEGKDLAWKVTAKAFTSRSAVARVRVMLDDRTCDASLSIAPHGGKIVILPDGPQVEVVVTDRGGLRLFLLEESMGERVFTLESPAIVVASAEGERVLPMAVVVDERGLWELADASALRGDVRLRATVGGGKVVETSLASFLAPAAVPAR